MAFQFWNLDVVAFCPLKKCLGIAMLCLICLRFSIPWCFQRWIWFYSPNLDVMFFWGHGIAISWLFGLGISILWFMCFHGFVFRGCPCNNLKLSINQNRRNRWCQIVRRTIWLFISLFIYLRFMYRWQYIKTDDLKVQLNCIAVQIIRYMHANWCQLTTINNNIT